MVRWAASGDDVDGLALRLVGGWTFADSSSYNITAFFTIPRTHRYFHRTGLLHQVWEDGLLPSVLHI